MTVLFMIKISSIWFSCGAVLRSRIHWTLDIISLGYSNSANCNQSVLNVRWLAPCCKSFGFYIFTTILIPPRGSISVSQPRQVFTVIKIVFLCRWCLLHKHIRKILTDLMEYTHRRVNFGWPLR